MQITFKLVMRQSNCD